jgi:RNA polymerase sigma-70 factor (ECF subfamily)
MTPDHPSALENKLQEHVDKGREAWPKVAIDPETFVAHLARHAKKADCPEAFVDTVHGSDLYLACGACRHDKAALAYFEEHFMTQVPLFIMRVRVGRDVVEDVQQKLRENLLLGRAAASGNADELQPKIAEYSGRGALGGWLRMAAVRTALNHIRSPATSEPVREDLSFSTDPELAYLKESARTEFGDAFRRVLEGLDPEQRTILRLHYVQGLTMDQLARLYKTPRSTVARRIAKVREQIVAETEALLREEWRLSPSAVASVIRQARSQLQLTITRLLK